MNTISSNLSLPPIPSALPNKKKSPTSPPLPTLPSKAPIFPLDKTVRTLHRIASAKADYRTPAPPQPTATPRSPLPPPSSPASSLPPTTPPTDHRSRPKPQHRIPLHHVRTPLGPPPTHRTVVSSSAATPDTRPPWPHGHSSPGPIVPEGSDAFPGESMVSRGHHRTDGCVTIRYATTRFRPGGGAWVRSRAGWSPRGSLRGRLRWRSGSVSTGR